MDPSVSHRVPTALCPFIWQLNRIISPVPGRFCAEVLDSGELWSASPGIVLGVTSLYASGDARLQSISSRIRTSCLMKLVKFFVGTPFSLTILVSLSAACVLCDSRTIRPRTTGL